jgi:transcription elongation factor GreA
MKYITPEGLEKLKKELQERKTIKRQEIAKRLREAKALGDLAENTEYTAVKEIQAFNEGRILELEDMIRNAVVIKPDKKKGSRKKVTIGSVVEVRSGQRKQSFAIVGSQEAQPSQGRISNESPLGQAFLGHQVGDIIEAETPGGKVKYKIVNIR